MYNLEPKPSFPIPHYFIICPASFFMKTLEPFQVYCSLLGILYVLHPQVSLEGLLPPFPSDKQLQQQWGGQCDSQAVSCVGCCWLLPDSMSQVSLLRKTSFYCMSSESRAKNPAHHLDAL